MTEYNQAPTSKMVEPFVRMEQKCSYWELLWLIQQILVNAPTEISRIVASFLIVPPILPSEVTAIRASSFSQSTYPISAVLNPSMSSWWISSSGTMRHGKGKEYIEFQLSSPSSSPSSSAGGGGLRRLCKFSIQIRAIPMCPLSVRRLRLEQYVEEKEGHPRKTTYRTIPAASTTTTVANGHSVSSSLGSWKPCSPVWTVEKKAGWQEYILDPPVDLRSVRLVCLTNQIHEILYEDRRSVQSVTTINVNHVDSADDDHDDDNDDIFADPFGNIYSCVGYCGVKFE